MREESTAHFDLIKIQNKRIVRNLLRAESPQGISSLSKSSGLSNPTVAALLKELVMSNEVLVTAELESCGGRPGTRYELNASYQYGCVMKFKDWFLEARVYDYAGKLVWKTKKPVTMEVGVEDILFLVEGIKAEYNTLSVIAIGVPGAVNQSEITYLPKFPKLQGDVLAKQLKATFSIDVLIENDMNATVYAQATEHSDFAHIAYMNGCIGVGIVQGKEVIKGSRGYAGELEYLCDELSNQVLTFAQCILALVCVLDLPEVILSGEACFHETIPMVRAQLEKRLPKERIPRIELVRELDTLYEEGLRKRIITKWLED